VSEEKDEQLRPENEISEDAQDSASGAEDASAGSGASTASKGASTGSAGPNGPRKLVRSSTDRILAGVCGGLGEYFAVDPLLFRLGFAIATLIGGIGLIAYVAAWIFLPEEPGRERHAAPPHPHDPERSRKVGVAIGAALILVGLALLGDQMGLRYRGPLRIDFYDYDFEVVMALAVLGFGLWLLLGRSHHETPGGAGAGTTGAASGESGATAGAGPHSRRLTRSVTDRKIAGVCGGLASYFHIDASLVRIGVVVITILTHFLAAIVYVVMALVVPEEEISPPSGQR